MAKARTRIGVVVFTAIIVALVGLGVGGYFYRDYLASTKYSPARQVERYLDAVVAGKPEVAVKMYRPGDQASELTLMSAQFAQAAGDRPTSYTVGDVHVQGKTAMVNAYLTMSGKDYPVVFKLFSSGTTDVFFDRWKIVEAPEQNLYVGAVPRQVVINGIEVELPINDQKIAQRGADAFPVLPGTYTISAPQGSKYVTFGEDQQVFVQPATAETPQALDATINFPLTYTDAFEADVKAEIEARIAQCFASPHFEPSGCERTLFMDDYGPAVTQIRRSWKNPPRFQWYPPSQEGDVHQPARMVLTGGDMDIKYKWRWTTEDTWEPDDLTRSNVFGSGGDTWVEVNMVSDGSYTLSYHGF